MEKYLVQVADVDRACICLKYSSAGSQMVEQRDRQLELF